MPAPEAMAPAAHAAMMRAWSSTLLGKVSKAPGNASVVQYARRAARKHGAPEEPRAPAEQALPQVSPQASPRTTGWPSSAP